MLEMFKLLAKAVEAAPNGSAEWIWQGVVKRCVSTDEMKHKRWTGAQALEVVNEGMLMSALRETVDEIVAISKEAKAIKAKDGGEHGQDDS